MTFTDTDTPHYIPLSKKYLRTETVPLSQRPPQCAGCPFGGIKVGSRGPVDSPFVIVGESPGANELRLGYPFVGLSGEMLDQVLLDCGWDPKTDPEPYILNAMQCFPRKKEPAEMGMAIRACNGRLNTLLAAHPRKVILSLGTPAGQALTGNPNFKVTKERGKLWNHASSEAGVVTAVHPAYLMRNGSEFGAWKRDVQYTVDLLHGKNPKEGRWAPPTWNVLSTREEYLALIEKYSLATHIAGDIETGGTDKWGTPTGLNFQKGYIINLGITSNLDEGEVVDIIPGPLMWEHEDLTKELFRRTKFAKWIWQNGKFDVKFLRYEGISDAKVDEDTMLLSYALNENKGHDLDTICWDHIGADKHKGVIDEWFASHGIPKKRWDYGLVPKDILFKYAAFDISKTYKVFWALKAQVDADVHSKLLYDRTLIPASEMLTQVEMKGLKMDAERVHYNDKYLLDKLQVDTFHEDGTPNYISPTTVIQGYAQQYLGVPINIGSYQQLQKLLYDKMKLGPPGTSTDDDHLIKIQRRFDHPIALALQRWRTTAKARNTYVKNCLQWVGPDGRVHVNFKIHASTTGRLSSGDPTNLQNWPRDPQIRGAFIAEDGHVLVECDLNQAELRCLAIMSADPTLVEIYTRNEVSIHHITSLALFGEHYTDDEKMRAKAINFGIVYGRSAPSVAEEFNISVREAEEYIRIWFERYPVAHKFIDMCRDYPRLQKTMITNFGRKKRWGVVGYENQRNLENEAANFPHQSTAHDITLQSGIEVQPVVQRLWGAEIVNEIHDALYFEVIDDPSVYGPMIAYVQHVMQQTPLKWGLKRVPFLAEAKVGHRWGAKRNAKETGITNEQELAEYMTDFKPSDTHRAEIHNLIWKEAA